MSAKYIGTGLQEQEKDPRDFSHDRVFGSATLAEFPIEFFSAEPMGIKDQKLTDFCAGYAGAAVSEDQEAVLLNPEYIWVQAKKALGGEEWKKWGLRLRDLCLAAVNKGFLEQEYYPFENQAVDRDHIANPANWSEELDMLSYEHRKNSFFDVDGPYDTFDNFRSVLWLNRNEQRSILTGSLWRQSWNSAPRGVIPRTGWETELGTGHAFKVFGWLLMQNDQYTSPEPHLVAQLSNFNRICHCRAQ